MAWLDVSGKSAIGGGDKTGVTLGNRGINFGLMTGDTFGGDTLGNGGTGNAVPLTAGANGILPTVSNMQALIFAGAAIIVMALYLVAKKKKS